MADEINLAWRIEQEFHEHCIECGITAEQLVTLDPEGGMFAEHRLKMWEAWLSDPEESIESLGYYASSLFDMLAVDVVIAFKPKVELRRTPRAIIQTDAEREAEIRAEVRAKLRAELGLLDED